jgi:hypothetical protein
MSKHHQSNLVHRFVNRHIATFPICVDGYQPPELDGQDKASSTLHPGEESNFFEATMSEVVEIAAVLTPDVVWYSAPNVGDCGGRAFNHPRNSDPRQVVFIRSAHPTYLIQTACCEAQHAVEALLTTAEIEILNVAAFRAAPWSDPYMNDPVELRADLFQDYAMHLRRGGMHVTRDIRMPENDLMHRIYTGEVGRRRQKVFAVQRVPKRTLTDRVAHAIGGAGFEKWLQAA